MTNRLVRARRVVARGPLARPVAFPVRLARGLRHLATEVRLVGRWLVRSREHTNFTYDLTELNWEHLAWWISDLADISVDEARAYLNEIRNDRELADALRTAAKRSPRRGIIDAYPRYGRRAGWYALVRATKPNHVVETGTDQGLGACVLAAALLRNGRGRLTTIDTNPESGSQIIEPYASVTDVRIGDSVDVLRSLEQPIDIFIHDSLHTAEHEAAEFEAIEPRLTARSYVLSDNAHETNALAAWAESNELRFSYFAEQPRGHWHRGGGMGAAA